MHVAPRAAGDRRNRREHWERWGVLYARLALGAAFLSGVAARFGLWGARSDWRDFADFTRYTAEVNSFMPAATIPFLAWAATAAELGLGLMLVLGVRVRWAALGSALLLALFATAMAISFGVKSPLDYSVFSASAGALLLAGAPTHRTQEES
jgi:putative oxidoreductase